MAITPFGHENSSHEFKIEEDKLRNEELEILGYTTIRFQEKEIYNDLENVIRVLEKHLENFQNQSP